jgi:uncharacterized RDD family membrane protein YckC
MHCKHCGFVNGEDDHRCLRCGRRLSGVVIAAPPGYSGANALAPALVMKDTEEFAPVKTTAATATSEQPTLFAPSTQTGKPGQNVIPFDKLLKEVSGRSGVRLAVDPSPAPAATPTTIQVRVRKSAPPSAGTDLQGTLDFIPGSPLKARRLKTDVDAQVFCDQPVATPTHRAVASAIDAAVILIGFGVLLGTFSLLGGSFGAGKMLWIGMGAAFTLVTMLYGLIWAIAGRETAGMRFTDLQLITFDGFPLDPRSRALRFASTWLSFCSGGLGLLWAVADEENLTWHDHISKTFPTIREVPGTFVKQRR